MIFVLTSVHSAALFNITIKLLHNGSTFNFSQLTKHMEIMTRPTEIMSQPTVIITQPNEKTFHHASNQSEPSNSTLRNFILILYINSNNYANETLWLAIIICVQKCSSLYYFRLPVLYLRKKISAISLVFIRNRLIPYQNYGEYQSQPDLDSRIHPTLYNPDMQQLNI